MQKGKFSAGAACLVSTLKNVDFLKIDMHITEYLLMSTTYPTFGSPTMPHFSEVPNLPSRGPCPSDSEVVLFFGGMLFLCLTGIQSSGRLASWLDDFPANNASTFRRIQRINLENKSLGSCSMLCYSSSKALKERYSTILQS